MTIQEIDEIQEIISQYKCPIDFQCYKSGFKDLCGTLMVHDGSLVECMDKKGNKCSYSFPFGSGFLCTCPLRLYIAKHFHK